MIPVTLCNEKAMLPIRAHPTDAGADLISVERVEIKPGNLEKIRTGIKCEIPDGMYGFIANKSSLGSKGLMVHGGIIDSAYRGEIIVMLQNNGKDPIVIEAGKACAQMIIHTYVMAKFVSVDGLSVTKRGEGGFGSSGL